MSRSTVRQCIAYLLIALLPLQAAASSRLALCAEMGAGQVESINRAEYCAQMGPMVSQSMVSQSSTDESSTLHHNSGCWLGSTCMTALILLALPVVYAGVDIDRNVPSYFPQSTFYLSIISERPLRPPTAL